MITLGAETFGSLPSPEDTDLLSPSWNKQSAGKGKDEFLTLPHTRHDVFTNRQLAPDSSGCGDTLWLSKSFPKAAGCGTPGLTWKEVPLSTGSIIQRASQATLRPQCLIYKMD